MTRIDVTDVTDVTDVADVVDVGDVVDGSGDGQHDGGDSEDTDAGIRHIAQTGGCPVQCHEGHSCYGDGAPGSVLPG